MVPAWTIRPTPGRPPRGARYEEPHTAPDDSHVPFDIERIDGGLFGGAATVDLTDDALMVGSMPPPDIDEIVDPLRAPDWTARDDANPERDSDPEPSEVPAWTPTDRGASIADSDVKEVRPAERAEEFPVWDPTGKHTRPERHSAPARRFSFADILGFGLEDEQLMTAETPLDTMIEAGPVAAQEAEPSDWLDFPRLADVVTEDPAQTNELIERLWHATAEHDVTVPRAEPQLAPIDLQQMFKSNRTFRWSVLAATAVLAILVVFVLGAIGRRPVTIAEQRSVAYQEHADRLAAALTGFDATARTITTPSTTTDELSALTADLLTMGTLAHELGEVAREPLPEPSLLGASAPIDRLVNPQELLLQSAEQASTVEHRLGDTLTYRVLIEQAFATGDLPVAANEGDIGDIGAELSVVEATTEQIVAQLPDDPFFATYTDSAVALFGSFREWQVAYLSALRDGDVGGAGVLRRDWQDGVAAFRAGIAGPLMAVDTWSSGELAHLRGVIDVALERLGDPAPDTDA